MSGSVKAAESGPTAALASDRILPRAKAASRRTVPSVSVRAAVNGATASLPISPKAFVALLRTSPLWSLSASTKAPIASRASGPMPPRASAAARRTRASGSFKAVANGFHRGFDGAANGGGGIFADGCVRVFQEDKQRRFGRPIRVNQAQGLHGLAPIWRLPVERQVDQGRTNRPCGGADLAERRCGRAANRALLIPQDACEGRDNFRRMTKIAQGIGRTGANTCIRILQGGDQRRDRFLRLVAVHSEAPPAAARTDGCLSSSRPINGFIASCVP